MLAQSNREKMMQWVKLEKEYLYKLGVAFNLREAEIEQLLLKTIQEQNSKVCDFTLLSEQEKLTFIDHFVNACHLKLNQQNVHEQLPKILHNIKDHQLIICLYFNYTLKVSKNYGARLLQISEEEYSKKIVEGMRTLVSPHESYSLIESLLNYHHGSLSLEEYHSLKREMKTDAHIGQLLENMLNVINHLESDDTQIQPSLYFLEPNKPLTDEQKKRGKRKQQMIGVLVASSLLMVIILSSIQPKDLTAMWHRLTKGKVGFGENVYVNVVDENIEIAVTHVAADDYQTVLYYRIRDVNDEFQYAVEDFNNAHVTIKETDIWNKNNHRGNLEVYSIPRMLLQFNSENEWSEGRLVMPPISNEEEMITVQFHSVEQFKKGVNRWSDGAYDPANREIIQGEWILEVPVRKHSSRIVELNQIVKINNIEINLQQLDIRPTATIIKYKVFGTDINNSDLYFRHLLAGEELYFPDYYYDYWSMANSLNSNERMFAFQSFFYKQPKDILVFIDRIVSYHEDHVEIEMDYDNIPFEFSFLGSTIKVEEVTMGDPVTISIAEPITEDRTYDHFSVRLEQKDELNYGYGMSSEGVWLDEAGNTYHTYDEMLQTKNPYGLRYFSTKQQLELFSNNPLDTTKMVLPEKMIITGYTTSHWIDEGIKVEIK